MNLYLCTPDRPDLTRFVAACIAGGVDVVQLREKHLWPPHSEAHPVSQLVRHMLPAEFSPLR